VTKPANQMITMVMFYGLSCNTPAVARCSTGNHNVQAVVPVRFRPQHHQSGVDRRSHPLFLKQEGGRFYFEKMLIKVLTLPSP
jgi:hypothetical protein